MAPVDRLLPGRPAARRQRAAALCIQSRSIGRSTGGTTVIFMTVGPVDRAVDRKGKTALSSCQRADFVWGYIYPILELFLHKNFKSKIFNFLSVLTANFKRVLGSKDRSSFVLKSWKNQRKREVFGIYFCSSFPLYPRSFFKYFLCVFDFQTLYFLTLELITILSIRIFVSEKRSCLWSL